MYYNMRIRTIHRNTSNVIRRAAAALASRVSGLRASARPLLVAHRDILAGLAAAGGLLAGGDGDVAGDILSEARRSESRLRSMLAGVLECLAQRTAAEMHLRAGLD